MDIGITGVGAISALGSNYQTIADNLLAGRSGIQKISHFPVQDHPSQIGGVIDSVPCPVGWKPEEFAKLPRVDQALLWCGQTALANAGLGEGRSQTRIGFIVGTAAEWNSIWEENGLGEGNSIYQPQQHLDSVVHRTCKKLRISGPAVSLSAACASGNYALALARNWLRMGWVDVCLAGACDMALTPISLAGFGNLRALSRRNDEPQKASRPFDRDRDGFVMGEGGAVFVLERMDQARRRSAHVYARIGGYGASSDAFHMVIPSGDPEPAIKAMRLALADAQISPGQVDYVNAHATGTPVGDVAEFRVLASVFGEGISKVPVSSTKSITGHLLTGAAAMEALACLVALQYQALPPTINLDNPDPECPLRHVPNQAQPHHVRVTASNSFGFGGSNTCLILVVA
jgi:3-oxoacyl-[acyl-carrier-protein] synthase II